MMTAQPHETCNRTIFQPFALGDLLSRVRGEFREMPGLRLTLDQAMRLWAMDRDTCTRALEQLVTDRFLEADSLGRFRKHSAGY